ncbi:MAG: hypothetical protein KR126chlam1_01330 [Chlamydiae bacterium]|nr:hypothetical protein [Chlamydiota bacterium]
MKTPKNFTPYVSAKSKPREFTFRAIVLGCILGLIFGVGNAYLGLKVGTTVSASIPAAVLSMTIMRTFFKRPTILENNLVQTIASVGEGLAGGVVFTVPALFILGAPPSMFRIFLLSALGGILGVLFMIPMRRYIIVEKHGELPFPEGTACAAILKSGERGGKKAILAISGIVVGALYKISSGALHLWSEVAIWKLPKRFRTEISIDCTPALLGVGFIIGPRIASILFAGGMVGWWVIIPLIAKFGTGTALIPPGTIPVEHMSPEDIWSSYVRYIGAGTVGIGGLLSLVKIFPLLGRTFHVGFKELITGAKHHKRLPRTDKDISMRWLILGSTAIILFLWLFPGLPLNFMTIILLVLLGFFFVAVTSITVGIVGSTSNPVSGMTITTLLITCLIFLAIGWTERMYLIAALTMSVVANVAIALAGTTSQDLKTGFILGATPRSQQIGEIIGILLPAITIGGTLYLLNTVYTFGSPEMPAPQGTLMALIAKGVISGNVPIALIMIGVVLGLFVEILCLPVLPFAIGLYLPFSLSSGIMVGGLVSALVRYKGDKNAMDNGLMVSSGLVAGDACTGVVVALLAVLGVISPSAPPLLPDIISLLTFAFLGYGLAHASLKRN